MCRLLGLIVALFFLGGRAADWPQFRGPTGDGHSTAGGLPIHWSATSNVAWRVPVVGRGWSSPVVVANRIYLTSAVGAAPGELSLVALAMDANTGRTVWQTEVFKPEPGTPAIHSKNSYASPTPIVTDNRLFVHFGHLGTACLDLDGRVQWRNSSLKYSPVHGGGGSPIKVNDLLIVACDGAEDPYVAALRCDSGEIAWRVSRHSNFPRTFSFSTAEFIQVRGQPQIVSPASGFVAAYDPENGNELWRVRYAGWSVIPKPVFGHGLVFVSTGYEQPTVIAVRPDGKGDVTETHIAWELRRGSPNTPSSLLVGDELYLLADSGVFSCLDARTGQVHYQERACGQSSASPVLADGRIYLQDERGLGVVLEPGRKFRKLAENRLDERTLASYAVIDGAFFIRSEEHLFKIMGPQNE